FSGGLVGNLGYDFVRYAEVLPDNNPDEIGIETIQMMLMTKFIMVDHVAETLTGVVLGEDSEAGRKAALEEAGAMITKARAHAGEQKPKAFLHDGVIVHQSDTLEQYCEKVDKIKHYIKEGHIFQTVLSQRWTVQTGQSGFDLYKELRELNPSPYLYYFNFGGFEIIGSSPEMIVKQQGKRVFTCPIAGTRRRGVDAEEDALLKDELLQDEKERAEHVMLVDLARNDMGRIAEFGTVKVTQFMEVQNYSHVMHIVSQVEGRKKGEFHPFDLVSSFLPAGTLSGAPKIRAMEIIDELETVRRGMYGGATGYVDFSGDMDFCITIRTMVKKGDKVYLQAGAGIVADSIPENEYQECCNKVMALAKTLIDESNL
ncbi:MAG: chorismate-binding protein, partial [Lachnospiraceae bacterium]|nr:chorismate-binding protein [Lachnospiraceae bacterium]